MSIPNNIRATQLLDAYLLSCLTDNSERARISKLITAYNKANPLEKLKAYHTIERNFPTAFKYICNKYGKSPEDIFENKFTKIFFNLNILPSIFTRSYGTSSRQYHEYSKLSPYMNNREDFFHNSYEGNFTTFKEITSGRLYTYSNKNFISQDDSAIKVSLRNLNALSLFVEV